MSIKYQVPNLTLDNALKLPLELDKVNPDQEFIFDFSKMSNFDPLPMLLTGATIREFRSKFSNIPFTVSGVDSEEKSYPRNMGFFKYISEKLNVGKMPGQAMGNGNYIPITSIVVDDLLKKEYEQGNCMESGQVIEREASRLAKILDRGNTELHKILTFLIREILRNTYEHADAENIWICGQYWPTYKLAEIAILDEGIGIYNSITQNHTHQQYIKSNYEALQWALKAGISESFGPGRKQNRGSEWANSGFGLYMVSEICKHFNGSFCIISYGNYILMDSHEVKEGVTSFKGTAIQIRLSSVNISNAQETIAKISEQGELEAKSIRNAFKTASLPSKGLMDELNIKSQL